MMKNLLFLFIIPFLLLSGCWILPSGDPPAGNITTNTASSIHQVKTPEQAIDYLVSSLTVALLSNCPGEKIQLDSDVKTSAFSARILQESGKISGNNRSFAASGWVLKSIHEKGIFQLELLHNGKTVWKEMLKYSFEPSLLN